MTTSETHALTTPTATSYAAELDPATYGRQWAADYDRLEPPPQADTEAALAALTRLANGRPILELAAGTGRIAIPLARAGMAVTATDVSIDVLTVLAEKDVDELVSCRVEDMRTPGNGGFGLVALLLNSLMMVLTSDGQQAVFAAAASHLEPGGRFVVETAVIDFTQWLAHRVFNGADGEVIFVRDGVWHPGSQRLCYVYHVATEPDIERRVELRVLSPAEHDLMAANEGFVLEQRWEDWDGSPFGPDSPCAISVYRLP